MFIDVWKQKNMTRKKKRTESRERRRNIKENTNEN